MFWSCIKYNNSSVGSRLSPEMFFMYKIISIRNIDLRNVLNLLLLSVSAEAGLLTVSEPVPETRISG